MSRLFATYLMKENGIEPDELASLFDTVSIIGKCLSSKNEFEFRVLDFYSYLEDRDNPYWYNVKINEGDLIRMMRIDTYSDDEKNELYYHKLLGGKGGVEQGDLDDDVYWGVSILQYFFHISFRTIADMKRRVHLYKLRRVESKTVVLKKRQLHSSGGRKLGSLGSIEWQNIENADRIIKSCVEKDRYQEFMELHKDLIRTHRVSFGITGAKWKFYILRYKWKVDNGFVTRDLDYEKELSQKNSVYKIFDNLIF